VLETWRLSTAASITRQNRHRSPVRIATDLSPPWRDCLVSLLGRGAVSRGEKMKVGAESSGLEGFSRLDWPASELLSDAGRMRNPVSGENFRSDCEASALLREAHRARAEALRRWCQSLLHELRRIASASLAAPLQSRAGMGNRQR
jgi:hypothetical protein